MMPHVRGAAPVGFHESGSTTSFPRIMSSVPFDIIHQFRDDGEAKTSYELILSGGHAGGDVTPPSPGLMIPEAGRRYLIAYRHAPEAMGYVVEGQPLISVKAWIPASVDLGEYDLTELYSDAVGEYCD